MTAVRSALIVVGGPARLIAAKMLRRHGIDASIVERNEALTPLGSGLTMLGPTLRALHQVDSDALEKCIDLGSAHRGMIFGSAAGETLVRMHLPQIAGGDFPGCFGTMRPFRGILSEMAEKDGAPIRLSTTVTSIAPTHDRVQVGFNDGTSSQYDRVIGADGLHSTVRSLVFPDAPVPLLQTARPSGGRGSRAHSASADDMGMYYGPRNNAGCNPVSDTDAYVLMVENARRTPRAKGVVTAARARPVERLRWRDRLGDA